MPSKRKGEAGESKKKKPKKKPEPKYVLPEFIDKQALRNLYELEYGHQEETSIRFLYEKCQKMDQRLVVGYYEDGQHDHPSLQDLPFELQKYVLWRNYHLLKIKPNYPGLLLKCFCMLNNDESSQKTLTNLRKLQAEPTEFWSRVWPDLKQALRGNAPTTEFIEELKHCVVRAVELDEATAEAYGIFECDADQNKEMRFLQHCIHQKCNSLLEFVYSKMEKNRNKDWNFTVGAICFNTRCLMVERKHRFTGELMTTETKIAAEYVPFPERASFSLVQSVLEEFGIEITIEELSLLNTPEELYDIDTRNVHLHKLGNDKYRQIFALLEQRAAQHHFKRQGDHVMRGHSTLPNVYVRHQDRKSFMEDVLMNHPTYQSGLDENKVDAWFKNTNCRKFGILKQNDRHIAFKNGRFDLTDVKFEPWDKVQDTIDYTHYYDQELHEDAQTPLWDRILQYQFRDGAEEKKQSESPTASKFPKQTLFEMFVGKTLFTVGQHDNWQVTSFIEGDANTGKSTLVKIIQAMFPEWTTDVISGNQESTFGLQGKYLCRCLFVPDCSLQFHKRVDQTDFQSFVSGDSISVPVKHGVAKFVVKWTCNLFMAGNKVPQYVDQSGSIGRRFFRFLFRNTIENLDGNLSGQILANELPTILVRCVKTYRRIASELGYQNFWKQVAGDDYAWMVNDTASKNNRLDQFLDSYSNETRIEKVEGATTTQKYFMEAFSEYLKKCGEKPRTYLEAGEAKKFKDRGFVEKECNFCSNCGKLATRETCNCGEKKKRVKWKVFENMQLTHYNSNLQEITSPNYITTTQQPQPYSTVLF